MFIYQNVFFFFFALSQLKPCILALYLIISLDIHQNSTAFAQEPLFLKKPMLWNIETLLLIVRTNYGSEQWFQLALEVNPKRM